MRTLVVIAAGILLSFTQSAGLRVVVIEGEDAVNVVQQRTATAPVVEVRDRNNLPVPGAVVTFTINSSGTAAFAGGAPSLTVTTNAAGRAVAMALNPLSSGTVQIQATAVFQGQTAVAAIAQTNVMTAAEAAKIAAGASAGGSSGGTGATGAGSGAGGGGGGVSGTTLGLAGAAVAGGVVAATQAGGDEPAAAAPAGPKTYRGSFSGQFGNVFTATTGFSCTNTTGLSGDVTMTLDERSGTVTGTADVVGTETAVATTCQFGPVPGSSVNFRSDALPVTGGAASLAFSHAFSNTAVNALGLSTLRTFTRTFTGSLNAAVITGTLTFTFRADSANETGVGSVGMPVTLR